MKIKIEIVEKKFIGDSLYLKIKKKREVEIPLCNFLHTLGLNIEDFDRAYEDVHEEYIQNSNNHFKAELVSSEQYIHLIIHFKKDKRKDIDTALSELK